MPPLPAVFSQRKTRRSASANGSGRQRTAVAMPNDVATAAMAPARVRITVAENAGCRRKSLNAHLMSAMAAWTRIPHGGLPCAILSPVHLRDVILFTTTLLAIVNPISSAVLFAAMAGKFTAHIQRQMANQSAF